MSNATQPTTRTASTLLESELPFYVAADEFATISGLSHAEAQLTLEEVWRMTQNPRMLEIEQQARAEDSHPLKLTSLAPNHRNDDDELDVSALAKAFIATVRSDFPEKLSAGPRVDTMNPGYAQKLQ